MYASLKFLVHAENLRPDLFLRFVGTKGSREYKGDRERTGSPQSIELSSSIP